LRECDSPATEGKGASANSVYERNEREAGEGGGRISVGFEGAEYRYLSTTYRAAFEARNAAAERRRQAQLERPSGEREKGI
jgi:hypothetical protein